MNGCGVGDKGGEGARNWWNEWLDTVLMFPAPRHSHVVTECRGEINSRHTLPIISGKKSDDAVFRIGGTDPIIVPEDACGGDENRKGDKKQSRLVQVGVSLNCSSSVNEGDGKAGNYSRIVGGSRVKDIDRYPYTALYVEILNEFPESGHNYYGIYL